MINYLVFHRTEKMLGNIGFVILSGAVIIYSTTTTYATTNVAALAGWTMLIFSIFNLILGFMKEYAET